MIVRYQHKVHLAATIAFSQILTLNKSKRLACVRCCWYSKATCRNNRPLKCLLLFICMSLLLWRDCLGYFYKLVDLSALKIGWQCLPWPFDMQSSPLSLSPSHPTTLFFCFCSPAGRWAVRPWDELHHPGAGEHCVHGGALGEVWTKLSSRDLEHLHSHPQEKRS